MIKALDISTNAILKIAVSILLFYFLFQIREILLWICFAFVLSIIFEKPIKILSKKFPLIFSALIVYLSFLFLLAFLIYFLSLPVFEELQNFVRFFPQFFEKISPHLKTLGIISFETFQELTQNFQTWLFKASKNLLSAISAVFGGIFATFSIFSLAFFISIEKGGIEKLIGSLFGTKRDFFLQIWQETKEKISSWFGARVLICFVVGLLTFVSLLALKVNYPFSLSILAGILNFIPILGPLLASLVLFLVALSDSLAKAIFVLVLFLLIQAIDAYVLSPIFAGKIVGLPPFLIMISLLVGGKIMGLAGAILAVPLAGIFFKVLKELYKE